MSKLLPTIILIALFPACTYETDSFEYAAGAMELGESDDPHAEVLCGNGLLEADEESDDGIENGDHAACNMHCVINVCGDLVVAEGIEECDDGLNNGPVPATCSDDCERR